MPVEADAYIREDDVDGSRLRADEALGPLGMVGADAARAAANTSYVILEPSVVSFDDNGFLRWSPAAGFEKKYLSGPLADAGTTDANPSSGLGNNEVGIYGEVIEGSMQYNWDLASDLGTFNLYSPIQNFAATYPGISNRINQHGTPYPDEFHVLYSDEELQGLSDKFGTLPTGETAQTHIIAKTKELANLVASKRKKKLTFTKATNKQQLSTQNFYSILTPEVTNRVEIEVSSTTGSFDRPAESQASGRTTYTSYQGSSY